MKNILSGILVLILISCNTTAQYVDFGRNKVQYNEFDWHTLSTEHFKIYFYPEMRELAEIGAAYAEESYRIHQQNFNYSLIDTVTLIFYSTPLHFKETNTTPGLIPDGVGGFFEFIKGRVVIPFDGSLGNFKHVIRHELCHVFMTYKVSNVMRTHRQTETLPPLWFTEGLAEFWSTEWDATAEMVIKDAVLNGYMPGLYNWENFYGTFFMYKMGQKALEYISMKYGPEKIALLMENMWMNDDFSVVMEKTIGKDYEAFDKEWLYYLKKQYFPTLTEDDAPSSITKNIFSEGFGYKPAYYSSGSREEVYFIGNRSGYTSIFRKDLKNINEDAEVIIEGERSEQFEEFHYFRSGLDISSKGIMTFATKKGPTDALHLYDINKMEDITNYSFVNIVQIASPSFSADGDKIVFSGTDMSGKVDLYIFEPKIKNLIRLTNDFYDDRDPDFSPNGKQIVFSSDRTSYGINNSYNLFIYNLQDNGISYLTNGDHVDFSPGYSEDGRTIVYTSTKGGVQNIWKINPDSIRNQAEKITNFTTSAFDPRWIDNDRIIFAVYENGGITIRMMDSTLINKPTADSLLITFANRNEYWSPPKIKSVPHKNELKYEKKYSMDIATSNISTDPVFGTNAGGILAMSDVLGNDQYYFLIFNNSESGGEFLKSFNIAITRVSLEKRMKYAYGIFHLAGTRYDLGDAFPYYQREFGGYFAISYPLSFFRRFDASISLMNSKRDFTEEKINRRALLLTNSLSYVMDNSLWGPTGPMDGSRMNATVSYTTDIQFSNVNYYTLILDYRRYLRTSIQTALAMRFMYMMNEGREARRWAIGGSWDLRGYPRFSIRGRKAILGSLEYRFPVVNLVSLIFPYDIRFDFPYIRGAAFIDAGNAWDEKYKGTLGSIGLGLRMNLWNIVALRYDFGKRVENDFKKLSDDWFHQFFFGWDF